jgi:hypothetical protein
MNGTRRTKDGLRWGFKTEAEAIMREIRDEMKLSLIDRMDAFKLAEHLDIEVVKLSSYGPTHPFVRHFRGKAQRRFSAVTIFLTSTERLILYNDFHHPGRQAADIAHECGHALLLHPPSAAFSSGGCRDVNNECELEATFLGGTLLVPNDAAMLAVRSGWTLEEAADKFGVSTALMRWRINGSGAKKIMDRARAKWQR